MRMSCGSLTLVFSLRELVKPCVSYAVISHKNKHKNKTHVIKEKTWGFPMAVRSLRLHASNARAQVRSPIGTKIPQAVWYSQKCIIKLNI